MAPSDDDLRRLHQSLARIDDAVADLARGPELTDPDSIEDCLVTEVARLRDCLAELMADPVPTTSPLDWRGHACALVRRSLALWSEPLRCEVEESGAALAVIDVDVELAGALVHRLVQIGCAHAGAGGKLRVEPRAENGCAAVQLTAQRVADAPPTSAALDRCRTLIDLATRLGGGLRFADAGVGTWSAFLRLPRAKR
jgi:hypothetical protein